MLGIKKTKNMNSIGNKKNFHHYLGQKLVIEPSTNMKYHNEREEINAKPVSQASLLERDNLAESDPKVKFSGVNPKNQDVLRVKKNKPNNGFSNFV